eukprot:CAMPEP_0171935454 /NCGR_PEP_ID=MMETSP0993-20121228/32935_1 /TAXON_ID=483369 /ORGANISM="non described non described, Strain CCMP2098" /LENGTH=153 /DNA_ID=CAMNT_0012576381 /DNA_START=70 /DNA_END=527 /DNA_ORIENTATION=+
MTTTSPSPEKRTGRGKVSGSGGYDGGGGGGFDGNGGGNVNDNGSSPGYMSGLAELKGVTAEQRQANARKGNAQKRMLEEQIAEKAALKAKDKQDTEFQQKKELQDLLSQDTSFAKHYKAYNSSTARGSQPVDVGGGGGGSFSFDDGRARNNTG